jgi:hypothetical protein
VDLNMDELKDIPFDTGKDVFNCWNGWWVKCGTVAL